MVNLDRLTLTTSIYLTSTQSNRIKDPMAFSILILLIYITMKSSPIFKMPLLYFANIANYGAFFFSSTRRSASKARLKDSTPKKRSMGLTSSSF